MTWVMQRAQIIHALAMMCISADFQICMLFLEWFVYRDGLPNTRPKSEQPNGAITSLVVGAPATLVGIAISPETILPFRDLCLLAHPKLVARSCLINEILHRHRRTHNDVLHGSIW